MVSTPGDASIKTKAVVSAEQANRTSSAVSETPKAASESSVTSIPPVKPNGASATTKKKQEIARIISVSPTTVSDYVSQAKLADLSHPLPLEIDDAALERLLFPPSELSSVRRPKPTWPAVHNELRRMGVTLELL